jgi:hypothetical protein
MPKVLSDLDATGRTITVGTLTAATAANLTNPLLTRIDSSSEGGQINFARSSDGAQYWYIDTYGSTSTPDLRIIENSTERFRFGTGGAIYVNGSAGTSGQVLTSGGPSAAASWTTVSGGSFTGGTLTSGLVLAAGSSSVNPLTFTTNSATTTNAAGVMEWTSGNLQFTNATATGRGVVSPVQFYSIAADATAYAGNGTAENVFTALTNGLSLESGVRYEFEGVFIFRNTATFSISGSITSTLTLGFSTPTTTYAQVDLQSTTGATATFGSTVDTLTFNAVTTALTSGGFSISTATAASGVTNQYAYVRVRGHLKTSAAGYFMPKATYAASGAGAGNGTVGGALLAGSWLSVKKTPESVGAWS